MTATVVGQDMRDSRRVSNSAEVIDNKNKFDTFESQNLLKRSDHSGHIDGSVNHQPYAELTKEQESRYRFLLGGSSDLFDRFVEARRSGKSCLEVLLNRGDLEKHQTKEKIIRHRAVGSGGETGEEDDLYASNDLEESSLSVKISPTFTESPPFVEGGRMRAYQIQGLNWLVNLYENKVNGILADEMGLGKTLQTLSLLAYLKAMRGIRGPHLLIVPKSTLQNWYNEVKRWVPSLSAFIFHGAKDDRPRLINEYLNNPVTAFEVCITSYEMCLVEKAALRKVRWHYLAIDEAHRLKNEASRLSVIVREFHCERRLLVTGTPLQNNLHELWALLNFLLPDLFSTSEEFDSFFSADSQTNDEEINEEETEKNHDQLTNNSVEVSGQIVKVDEGFSKNLENSSEAIPNKDDLVKQLRILLEPFLLRRLKSEVEKSLLPKKELNIYVPLSSMQRQWYRKALERDIHTINTMLSVAAGRLSASQPVAREGAIKLHNVVMQLRKCCNHPYLFDGAEPGPPFTTDEHLVYNCGKLQVLDGLMQRWRENGNRVLLFSQMSRMLDILEDFCELRGYETCRIDGQTPHEERIASIDEFNRPGSEKFVFLLTTRAGGLGINLATADTVVLYDSDWNPQVDLQAQDRAHRIGQKKQVCVFRLVTEGTIEEKIIEKALQKLRLDQLVIQQGRLTNVNKTLGREEMLAMIKHGAEKIIQSSNEGSGTDLNRNMSDLDIEKILQRAEERTRDLQEKYQHVGLDDLQRFASTTVAPIPDTSDPSNTSKNFVVIPEDDFELLPVNPNAESIGTDFTWATGRRGDRGKGVLSYGVDEYFRSALRANRPKAVVKAPTPRGHPTLYDFQFYPARLHDLLEAELLAYQKAQNWRIPVGFYSSSPGSMGNAPQVPGEKGGTKDDLLPEESEEGRLEREREQALIDEAVPLTEDEIKEKETLLATSGFGDWARKDYQAFLRGVERHGRNSFSKITEEINISGTGEKSLSQVKKYSKHFWAHVENLADYEKIEAMLDRSEERLKRCAHQQAILEAKIARHKASKTPLKIIYFGGRGKYYTEEEDIYILKMLAELGIGSGDDSVYEVLARRISEEPIFRLDWFIRTRTVSDLSRRANKLIGFVEREQREIDERAADRTAIPRQSRSRLIWDKQESMMSVSKKARSN